MLTGSLPLPSRLLPPHTTFCTPSQKLPARVTLDSSALEVMTDLRCVCAVTIRGTETIAEAQRKMNEHRVHALFVVDEQRGLAGFITSTDIHGERAMKVIAQRACGFWDILVEDIMTPAHELEALDMADVPLATVRQIIATLKSSGRQHAMAIEFDARGGSCIRGLFSARQIERQVGGPIQTTEIAHNFSEIVALLV